MFVVFLRFSENKAMAPEFMAAHNSWIQQGMDEEVFLLVGSLKPQSGGCIITHETDRELLEKRINADPFVRENIVSAEINEINILRADKRLNFLIS